MARFVYFDLSSPRRTRSKSSGVQQANRFQLVLVAGLSISASIRATSRRAAFEKRATDCFSMKG